MTWVDDGPTAAGSGRIRTLDALLPSLLHPRAEVLGALFDPAAYGAPCGPRGVHAGEPTYEPRDVLARAGVAAARPTCCGSPPRAPASDAAGSALVRSMLAGVERSGYAEYWEADTGAPLGAVPQTWSSLALPMRVGR